MDISNNKLHANWSTLTWAYSPCPNDTFIFGALALRRVIITLSELEESFALGVYPSLLDIDDLNGAALHGVYDVIKISAALYPYVDKEYQILNVGGAFGIGVGPVLVAAPGRTGEPTEEDTLLIPGFNTTANLLIDAYFPQLTKRKRCLFSEIPAALARGEAQYGILIHEGRFTYHEQGLTLVADLGELRAKDGYRLLPLGLICIKRAHDILLKRLVLASISCSIQFAKSNPKAIMPYVMENAQEMDEEVMKKHIMLYVNEETSRFSYDAPMALQALLNYVNGYKLDLSDILS